MRSKLFFLLVLLSSLHRKAQSQNDTMPRLSEQGFLAIVRAYHPVAKQASNNVLIAKAGVTIARGGFDPVLTDNFERKRFGGDLYYSYYNPELQIPTWYGVELYTGIENINGTKLNPESSVGQTSYLGASVPLLKDLVIDKRRAALQQAKLFVKQSEAEQQLAVNDLLFDAVAEYWEWLRAYQVFQIFDASEKVNLVRFGFVKQEVLQGNRPAIDTVEALTQLQQVQLMKTDAYLKFQNETIALSAYMWSQTGEPVSLNESIVPDDKWKDQWVSFQAPTYEEALTLSDNHPKLKSFGFKLDALAIEKKLKFQSLLPKFDAKMQLLNKGYNVVDKVSAGFLENNYKFGFQFVMPLRLSEARGAYKQAGLKIQNTVLDQSLTQLGIRNKVKTYYNEVFTLKQQIVLYENAVQNYYRLLIGERQKYEIGESTLFVLNSREQKWLEASQKLIELKTKYYKSNAGLVWAAGGLR